MSNAVVRSDHDQLKQIVQSFTQQADAINNMNQQIKSCVDTLQGGDWIGKGANAFFQEMSSSVVPSLVRMQKALTQAARVTNQVSQLMKQAEGEAAGVLHM